MTTRDTDDDYRFAWRWVLPGPPSLVMTGDKAADTFLREGIPAQPGAPKVVVINADAWAGAAEAFDASALSDVDCFAVFGSWPSVRKLSRALGRAQADVRDYGLLPPRAPRVVVPLSSRKSAIQGLSLHNPGSRHARWALWVLRRLAAWGVVAPLRQQMVRLISHDPLRPWVLAGLDASTFGGDDFALYLGAKGSNRKTVALPTGGSRRPERIIKTAEHALARKKLANEALMLRRLAGTTVSDHIPALVSFHETESVSVLVQEYRVVTPSNQADQQDAAARFLDLMYLAQQGWGPLDTLMQRADHSLVGSDPCRVEILDVLRQKVGGLSVPIGLVHGDFAPWNCGFAAGQLVVYDWEEGQVDGLPLEDAFTYVVFPLLLVHHISDSRRLAAEAITFARRAHAGRNLEVRAIQACLVFWSLRRAGDFFPAVFTRMASEVINDL